MKSNISKRIKVATGRGLRCRIALASGLVASLLLPQGAWAGSCTCGSSPSSTQVQLYQGPNFTGNCVLLEVSDQSDGATNGRADLSQVCIGAGGGYGANVSSVKVGSAVKLLAFNGASYAGQVATYEANGNYTAGSNLGNNADNSFRSTRIANSGSSSGQDRITHSFWGDSPTCSSGCGTFWSDEAQGLAHDLGSNSWFITNNTSNQWLMKAPFSQSLGTGTCANPSVCQSLSQPQGGSGYNHFGDPDAFNGFVLVPNQGGTVGHIEVYRASPLTYLGFWQLAAGFSQAGWIAVKPNTWNGATIEFWVGSTNDYTGPASIQRYSVHLDGITWDQPVALGDGPQLRDLNGIAFSSTHPLTFQQGGVFTPDGHILYTSFGSANGGGTVRAFRDDGWPVGTSGNNYGPFNFQNASGEEPEGLDFLDMGTSSQTLSVPGFGSSGTQLHVILVNDFTPFSGDNIWLKHYRY